MNTTLPLRTLAVLWTFGLFVPADLAAQMPLPNPAAPSPVSLQLRFSNQTLYYPDTPVLLQVSLRNLSAEVYRFRAADIRPFNLRFEVQNLSRLGQMLPAAETFNEQRFNNQPVFFRELSLQPGEEFSFVVDLKEYVQLGEPGLYTLKARFFPELAHRSQLSLVSNTVNLSVRPPLAGVNEYQARVDAQRGELLARQGLKPDEVVDWTLKARQAQHSERFFLYLDLESLYLKDPLNQAGWRRLSAAEREAALRGFRDRLWSTRDEAISLVPNRFLIENTQYTAADGQVSARLWFDEGDFFQIRRYTFLLKKRDGFWAIDDYVTQNLEREPKPR